MKICVYGAGAFGFVLARHFGNKLADYRNHEVVLYGREQGVIEHIKNKRTHLYHFPKTKMPMNVVVTNDVRRAVMNSDIIILAVPSGAIREVCGLLKQLITNDCVIVNCAKGLDFESGKRLSEVISSLLADVGFDIDVACFSGGTPAEEMAEDVVLGAEIACKNRHVVERLVNLFSSNALKVYGNLDIAGVEYAGAFKNVIAILSGILDGLKIPFGTKTYLICRAARQAAVLAVQLGGNPRTFSSGSLAWENDLWLSCFSDTRDREFGEFVGRGASAHRALERMAGEHKTVEGYYACKVMFELARKNQLLTPTLDLVYGILHEGKGLREAREELLKK